MKHIKIKSLNKTLGLWLIFSTVITMTLTLKAAPLKIMMLGDSITEGGGLFPVSPDQNKSYYNIEDRIQKPDNIGYRGELWRLLIEAGYVFGTADTNLDFVGTQTGGSNYNQGFDLNHEGHSGYTSARIRDGIEGWLAAAPTDIVLLHIGANDPGKGIHIGRDNDSNQDANTTVNNVKKILNSIFTANPNTKVFVARIIEVRRAHTFAIDNGNWRTETLNNNISAMINNHTQSKNIRIVDMEKGAGLIYSPCGTKLGDMQPFHIDIDGIIRYDYHPNVNGYKKMAKRWFIALQSSGSLTPERRTNAENLWHLDEVGSPFLDSLNENNGTCSGIKCPTQVLGKVGKAVSFSGAQKLTIPASATLDFNVNESYTIEFWMKANDHYNHVAIGRGNSEIKYLWIGASYNKVKFAVPGGPDYGSSTGTIDFGSWTHVALVKDTNLQKVFIYLNGECDSEHETINHKVENAPITIGSLDNEYYFDGSLDEVVIYRNALSGAEVQAHYLEQSGANDAAPVVSEVSAVQTPTNDTTPSYTFNTSKAGRITYSGGCTSSITQAQLGNNIITFSPLDNAVYDNCNITVTDAEGSVSNKLVLATFKINTALATQQINLWSLDELNAPFSNFWGGSTTASCVDNNCPTQVEGKVKTAQNFRNPNSNDGTATEENKASILKVTVNEALNFSASDSYSFEFWMKPESAITVDNEVVIRYGNLWIGRRHNKLKIQLPGGPKNLQVGTLSINNWNHIAVVKDASEKKVYVYIDGNKSAEHYSDTSRLNSTSLYIGDYTNDLEDRVHGFNGVLDEIAIYNGALSASEVQTHYNTQSSNNNAPEITLIGLSTINLVVGDVYTDKGATASDAEDGDITPNIVTASTVNTALEGTYCVTYDVKDSQNLSAVQVTRTVVVAKKRLNIVKKDWLNYNSIEQKAIITPKNSGLQSIIMAQEITIKPVIMENKITLSHTLSKSYIIADENGYITTGFADDSTLKMGTVYKAGTKSTVKIQNTKIIIETSVKLAKDEFIIIGGI